MIDLQSNETKLFVNFPGQGSQMIKMGKDFYDNHKTAKEVFEEVDEALKYKLSDIIFGDDNISLCQTNNAQPAIMAVSIAITRTLEKELGKKITDFDAIFAGHSLGEYSALCATEALSLSETAKVLYERGNAMHNAVQNKPGGMVALIGASLEQANNIIDKISKEETLVIANHNSTGQIVLSGSLIAIESVIDQANSFQIKRAIKLPVSGPFHSPLMKQAEERMQEVINNLNLSIPKKPIISNINAMSETDPDKIKKGLIKQITGTVNWQKTMELAHQKGFTQALELGKGKVNSGLVKKSGLDFSIHNIDNIEDLQTILQN